jgi:hypothetical protein
MSRSSVLGLLGLLALLVVACVACKSNDDKSAPGVAPGSASSAAGKVIDVAGKVTVGSRAVAVGDGLAAEDVIDTGADGRIVVELTHNLAHWELGPNKHQKVHDSIAWALPRNEANAKIVIQDMSSAGRPAERNAAETTASAPAPTAVAETGKAARPEPTPPPPPAPASIAEPKPSAVAGDGAPGAVAGEGLIGGGEGDKGGLADRKANVAGPERLGQGDRGGGGGGPPKSRTLAPTQPTVGLSGATKLIIGKRGRLVACLGPEKPEVVIHVKIDADGKPTTKVDGIADKVIVACIEDIIGKLQLPHEATTVNLTLSK